jgi:hypothetical protein
MRIFREHSPSDSTNHKVTVIWGADGWSYIPAKKIRRKFFSTYDSNCLEMVQEIWEGIIPIPEYEELVTWEALPDGAWREGNEVYKPVGTSGNKTRHSRS